MAHVAKYPAAAIGNMANHYGRVAGDGKVRGNEYIDPSRTKLNYNLASHQTMGQVEFIRQRCSQVRMQQRRDVNVMACWVITAPKDLPESRQRDFFKASYDFLSHRYGEENVVSSFVHMDETTPHMHFAFVPVAEDKRRGGFKVSAKEVLTRSDLRSFHEDLSKHVQKCLGFEVSILNGATKEGNRSMEELKREFAAQQLVEARQTAEAVHSAYRAEKAFVDDFRRQGEAFMSMANVKKPLMGEATATLPLGEWQRVSHLAAAQLAASNSLRALDAAIATIEQPARLRDENNQLRRQSDELRAKVECFETALSKLPTATQAEFWRHVPTEYRPDEYSPVSHHRFHWSHEEELEEDEELEW